jgi:signal transduction histidine kinase
MTLWRFTFTRVAAALFALLLLVGSAGFLLVTRPALERHAQLLANSLLPVPNTDCAELGSRVRQLAADSASGIRMVTEARDVAPFSGWLLPFDALLVDRLSARSGMIVQARSTVDALHVRLRCTDSSVELALDRRIALGAAPDLALVAWLAGLTVGALGIAAWLSRALGAPLWHLMTHVRGTPLGAAHASAAPIGIVELDQLGFEVDALRERASQAVVSRTALLMGLSHDLRAPLARIRLILDTAQPVTSHDAREMKDHVLEMQEGLDEFMRAANAMAAAPTSAGARIVWERLLSLFVDPRIAFNAKLYDLEVPLNSAALLRIASNLIDNALRHGKGRVEVSWRRSGDAWSLCVSDQGQGIAPELLQRAQRAFCSEPGPEGETAAWHAGIGLALARILCEHNGWTLSFGTGESGGLRVCVEQSTPPLALPVKRQRGDV